MQAITDSSKSVYECLRETPTVFHKKPRNGVELVKQLALRSGAVVRSLLVQSFLRRPKDATDTFLSKHVHVREILRKISCT